MKRTLTSMLILVISLSAFSQEEKIKTGWNFGALPAITYSTDLGFQYGAVVNLFDYGDGSGYPVYNQKFYIEVSRFTKGSSIYRLMYETKTLIPGLSITSDLAYLTDQAYDFYGFNGYDAVYNADWTDSDLGPGTYKSRLFYNTDRKLFRFKNDVKGRLAGEHFQWNAGLELKNFQFGPVNIDKLNEGKDEEEQLPDIPGLYERYIDWGLIGEDEASGGFITTLKAGITYDTRDFEANPMKGIWFETGVEASPSFLSDAGFAKFFAIFRQYFTIVPEDLSFAYRLGYQTTIAGDVPWYHQNQIITSVLAGTTSEGLGGSKNVRGVLRNRIVGDGLFYANAEFRWKAIRFSLINQNFYLGFVAFSDFGMVTSKVDIEIPAQEEMIEGDSVGDYFDPGSEKMHISAGGGLRLVMNENFIVSADLGKALNEQDGNIGFYIGLNYLF
ncbi:MAG: Omp85 family outer membrane protein [Bacteroidota bacterium]